MPYIVVIIDELADLMQTAPADVGKRHRAIDSQGARRRNSLIIATQTPRREVVTGVIRQHSLPRCVPGAQRTRLARHSRRERRGDPARKGDLLYLPPGSPKLVRGQGAFVSDDEVKDRCRFCAAQAEPVYNQEIHSQAFRSADDLADIDPEDWNFYISAFETIRQEKRASTSMLQRRLRLGYNRAAWVMDHFERIACSTGKWCQTTGNSGRLGTYEFPTS